MNHFSATLIKKWHVFTTCNLIYKSKYLPVILEYKNLRIILTLVRYLYDRTKDSPIVTRVMISQSEKC